MTVQIDWPPEVVERLTDRARSRGLSLDRYLLESIQPLLDPDLSGPETIHRRDEAVRVIREIQQANMLGPELTLRDLIEEGRRF